MACPLLVPGSTALGAKHCGSVACRIQKLLVARPSRCPCDCSAGGWKGPFRAPGRQGARLGRSSASREETPAPSQPRRWRSAGGPRRSPKATGFAAIGTVPVLQQNACSGLGERQHRRGAQAWLEGNWPGRFGIGVYRHREVNHTEFLSLGRKTTKGKIK